MGLHRSGTTLLYKILNETGNFIILTTYDVIHYDQLLYNHINKIEKKEKSNLNNLMQKKGIINRKFDQMKVGANREHEYVDIFLNRNYSTKLTQKNNRLFDEMCRKLKFISKKNKPILLKNPFDYPNFLKIKELYPNAKFIFIHRHPLDVLNSCMYVLKSHYSKKNNYIALYDKNYSKIYNNPLTRYFLRFYYIKFPLGIFQEIFSIIRGNNYYLKNINKLSEKDYIPITYETLCSYPNKTIQSITNFLDIKCKIDFSNYIKPRKLKLYPEVKIMKRYIFRKMKPYFEHFDYKI